MKHTLRSIICALITLPLLVLGEGERRTFNAKVTDGSLSVTNDDSDAYCVSAVAFTLPSSTTNTFSISRIRPIVVNSLQTVITTNSYFTSGTNGLTGVLSTNVYNVKSIEYATNTMFSASTTNSTDVVYDCVTLKEGWHAAPRDIIKYNWTSTNVTIYVTIDAE